MGNLTAAQLRKINEPGRAKGKETAPRKGPSAVWIDVTLRGD